MWLIWLLLIVPGLICLYALIIRGLLHKIPALQKFYAEADGFWAKVWAICGNSLTMVWAHVIGGIGSALELLDPVASAVGDPDFKTQVSNALQANPKILGWVLIGISTVTIVVRLRSITKVV